MTRPTPSTGWRPPRRAWNRSAGSSSPRSAEPALRPGRGSAPRGDVAKLSSSERLGAVLEDARTSGFLGPGPVEPHLRHGLGYVRALRDRLPGVGVDLGTGGGVPGLLVALELPEWSWFLVESNHRRAVHLRTAIATLGLGGRVVVAEVRAEVFGREPAHRARAHAVTARSFAAPAVTAECAAPLLVVGGVLIASEPPESSTNDRWPLAPLAEIGLSVEAVTADPALVVVRRTGNVPAEVPRRVGIPSKRPRW